LLMGLLLSVGGAIHPLAPAFFFLPMVLMILMGVVAGDSQTAALVKAVVLIGLMTAPVMYLRLQEAWGPINPLHETVMPTLELGSRLSVLWPGMVLQQLGWLGCVGIVLTPLAWKHMEPGWGRRVLVAAVVSPLIVTLVPGVFDVVTRFTSSFPIKSLSSIPAFFVVGSVMLKRKTWFIVFSVLGFLAVAEALPGFHPQHGRSGRTPGMEQTLASLKRITPSRTVVADPWLSYLLAAETIHYPITVIGQHGHPLDTRGPERLAETAAMLSEYCPQEALQRILDYYGNPLVAVPVGEGELILDYGASAGGGLNALRLANLLDRGAEERVPGVLEFPKMLQGTSPGSWESEVRFEPPGILLAGPRNPVGVAAIEFPKSIRAGAKASLVLWWRRSGSWQGETVEAHLRLEPKNVVRGIKPVRKIREALGRSPISRLRAVQSPFRNAWPPSCWVAEGAVSDTLSWSLPKNLPAGNYVLRAVVLEQEVMPRIRLRDVLSEDDRWQGPIIGEIEILP